VDLAVPKNPASRGTTVLLIDDMDDLDIDRAPNSIYGKRDEELTAPLKSYFDVLLEHGDAATPPPGAAPSTTPWAGPRRARWG
jgi:hypothetical protein